MLLTAVPQSSSLQAAERDISDFEGNRICMVKPLKGSTSVSKPSGSTYQEQELSSMTTGKDRRPSLLKGEC